ncbi:hypothetical protein [Wansuia hejianensis]|uniref:Uncharacterized protein n=1 Tax=Wansuia hejianensis TaxID=2763667 RepID=A0A926EX91_9FIRM|nr:hypothetical protein [Wansuia hejianensis]MBC8590636.1 hypothetical protein [Wansuia hejianensis]
MKCYNLECKERCDDIKAMYCIFRLSEVQQRFIALIRKSNYCNICGEMTVKARYKGERINLCTKCGVRGYKIAG